MRRLMLLFWVLAATVSLAQEKTEKDEYDEDYEFPEGTQLKANLGLGLGIDYGVIGAKLSILPAKNIGIFASGGYNLVGLAWNVGVTGLFAPEKKVCPFASLMYGANAFIVVDGMPEADKTYYGATLGGGIQLKTRRENFWSFGLWIPFRSQAFRDDLDVLKNDPNVVINSEPLPVAISAGYHFQL